MQANQLIAAFTSEEPMKGFLHPSLLCGFNQFQNKLNCQRHNT
jgi:hypothetical protein